MHKEMTIKLSGLSPWQQLLVRVKKNKLAVAGFIVICSMGLLAVLAPWLTPYSYSAQDLVLGPTPPSLSHWLGTDLFGRDLFTRILYGSRISLMVAGVATAVALIIGILWGAVAGYAGGFIDNIMMRIVDILYALPFTIFIILLMVTFGRNIFLLFLAIGAVEWLTMARIVRGQVIRVKQQGYIEAAISFGLSRWQIIRRHVLPNIAGHVVVYTTLTIPNVILLESFLSFLGLGVQPPHSSWGILISQGVETMEEYPWLLLCPALAFSLTLFSLNFLGDGLRDALDVQTSKT